MKKKKDFSYTVKGSPLLPEIPLPLYFHSMGHVIRHFPYREYTEKKNDFVELYW